LQPHNIAPDFIKIDVEGSEMNVFKGAIHTLKKYKPRIIAEVDKSS
jgi:FkbM family methyltransferase